jgi:hypothetical protein
MLAAIVQRRRRALSLVVATTLVTGALAVAQPPLALALVLIGAAGALAWSAPVVNLTLALLLTMILPRSLQRELALGFGTGLHGLFPSDLLLFAGLARAIPELLRMRLERRAWLATAGIALLLAVALLQMLHGFSAGWGLKQAGGEARGLLYFGTFLVALPILADERRRERLFVALFAVGIALGLWGLVQWGLGAALQLGPEVGLRPGVRFTSAGRGQVQGGMYAFPVITVIALAVLALGRVRSTRGRALLFAVAMLNAVSLLFTHTRTFWIATVAAMGFVALRAGPSQAPRVIAVTASVFGVALATVRALQPREITTARERVQSVGQYRRDSSVRYRVVESRHLLERIRAHPFIGSGLGATISWGQPWANKPVRSYHYAHNGYLVLAWKLGIPAGLVLIGLLSAAVAAPPSPGDAPLAAAVQSGCQGGLLALLIAGIMFPSFTSIQIVSAMGVMLAACVKPASKRRPSAHLTCSRSKSRRSILAPPTFASIRPRWSHSLIR